MCQDCVRKMAYLVEVAEEPVQELCGVAMALAEIPPELERYVAVAGFLISTAKLLGDVPAAIELFRHLVTRGLPEGEAHRLFGHLPVRMVAKAHEVCDDLEEQEADQEDREADMLAAALALYWGEVMEKLPEVRWMDSQAEA